jgi:phosphatidylglycerol lysyltransferase
MPSFKALIKHPQKIFILGKSRQIRSRLALKAVALMTGLIGVMNVVSAVTPALPERMEWLEAFLPFTVQIGGRIFAALSGFILLTLATHLLRRKRAAWWLTIGLILASIISHLVKGLDYEECVIASILLGLLWMTRHQFTARSDPPSTAQGVKILIGALFFTLAYGAIGFYVLDNHFKVKGNPVNFGVLPAITQTLAILFTEDDAGLQPIDMFAVFFRNSIYVVGITTITVSIWLMLRPVLTRGSPATIVERKRARQLIDHYGQSSLARLALLSDKAYYFSPSGQSVIAYVAKGRAAIALGDPIGDRADRQAAIVAFRAFCDQNDWFPVFYEVLPDQLGLYHTLGLRSVQIGEEAIVNLEKFSLKGKSQQNLRTAINRLQKSGHRFELLNPPIGEALMSELKVVSDAWLQAKNGAEKRFSMGWFDREYLRDCMIGVVYDANNTVIAFANLLSGYHRLEITVDLMRYRSQVEKGTMEFLFASLLLHFQALKYDAFNFSLSPLAGVGEAPEAHLIEKGLGYFFEHLNQFYNFKGLHQFKEKFQPNWEPRYLVYPKLADLPDVAIGLVRADAGDRLWDYFKP